LKVGDPQRYALYAGSITLAVALLIYGLAWSRAWQVPGWAIFGWLLASVTGVGFGARLVSLHGTPGSGFMVALGTCILARLFAFAGGAAWAVSRSYEEAIAFLAGLVIGYVPTQVFELVWFASRTKDRNSMPPRLPGTERE
jgi:hypothetical protein